MVKKTLSGYLSTCAAVIAVVMASCGIFSPRDSETPEIPGRLDPLNFKAILAGTGEQFTKLQYEDLLSDTLLYEDMNSGPYSKDRLIQRLHYIQQQYLHIQVRWTAGGIWKNSSNDTIILSGLKYSVFLSGDYYSTPDDSGSSNFTVVKGLEWHISQWYDMPAGSGKSFYSP